MYTLHAVYANICVLFFEILSDSLNFSTAKVNRDIFCICHVTFNIDKKKLFPSMSNDKINLDRMRPVCVYMSDNFDTRNHLFEFPIENGIGKFDSDT